MTNVLLGIFLIVAFIVCIAAFVWIIRDIVLDSKSRKSNMDDISKTQK